MISRCRLHYRGSCDVVTRYEGSDAVSIATSSTDLYVMSGGEITVRSKDGEKPIYFSLFLCITPIACYGLTSSPSTPLILSNYFICGLKPSDWVPWQSPGSHPSKHFGDGSLPSVNEVWGKLIFSHACVIPSVRGGEGCWLPSIHYRLHDQGVCI